MRKTANKMKLTKSAMERLAGTGKRRDVWDTDAKGFKVRISPDGTTKTFYYDYRPRGMGRRVSATSLKLGSWPTIDPDDARTLAKEYAVEVMRGGDPAVSRRAVAEADVQARENSLATLLAEDGRYEKHLQWRKLVNWKTAMSSLRRNLAGVMNLEPRALTRKDFSHRIETLNHAGTEGAATDFKKFANGFIQWYVNDGLAEHNVLAGWKLPAKTRAQRVKEQEDDDGRALDDAEIKAPWRAAEAEHNPILGALIKTYLLTGFRRTEGARLKRSAITAAENKKLGLTGERFEIKAIDAKNGFVHAVPVTDPLRAIIRSQPETTSEFLFPSYTTGRPMSGFTKMVRRLQKTSGVDFTLHDLRRTCRTRLSMLGVDRDIAELCIGHVRPDLERRYDKFTAWEARVEAFEKYNAHIIGLVGGPAGGNVVPLRPASHAT